MADFNPAGSKESATSTPMEVSFYWDGMNLSTMFTTLEAPCTPEQLLQEMPKSINSPSGSNKEWIKYFLKYDSTNRNICALFYPEESWTSSFLHHMAKMHREFLDEQYNH